MKKKYLWLVRQTFRTLRHKRLRHRPWWRKLTAPLTDRHLWKPTRDTVAAGLAIGMFFAVMPMPGQAIASALLAMRFRANVPFAVGACFLSNPFTAAPIIFGQLWLGTKIADILGLKMLDVAWFKKFLLWLHESEWFKLPMPESILIGNTGDFLIGVLASGVLLAACSFALVHCFSALLPHYLPSDRPPGRLPIVKKQN